MKETECVEKQRSERVVEKKIDNVKGKECVKKGVRKHRVQRERGERVGENKTDIPQYKQRSVRKRQTLSRVRVCERFRRVKSTKKKSD